MPWPAVRTLAPVVLVAALASGCADSPTITGGADSTPPPPTPSQVSPSPAAQSPTPASTPTATLTPSREWAIDPGEQAADAELGAFAGAASILPGDPLDVYTGGSASGPGQVSVFRVAPYGGAGGALVAGPLPITIPAQAAIAVDPQTRAISATWPVTTQLDTAGWPPGFYLIQVIAASGKKTNVPLVVRSAEVTDAVVFVAGDLTWQAYNTWGGRSLYTGPGGFADRSFAVSFDRPYSADWQIWFDYDISAINVLEATGVEVAYTAVSAVAADPGSLDGAAGVVSNGHDEYWPLSYRDALVRARDTGSNLAFLGANAGYWRVRLADSATGVPNRQVVGYKSAALDPLQNDPQTTARYRDQPFALPENTVIGQLYDCFPSRGDMTIIEPTFFLFAGTGVARDTAIPGLVGNESDRAFARPDTPRPIQVPALSLVSCKGGQAYSTMTYYTAGSGAGVWSSGTMNWGRALAGPREEFGLTEATTAFTRTVTANLFRAMAQGPMGLTHPARDDYALVESLPAGSNA